MAIPNPAIERLVEIYRILIRLEKDGENAVSSTTLGEIAGTQAHNIRKDISYLGNIKSSRNGYAIRSLADCISERLNLGKKRKSCVVGLGRLGQAILGYERFQNHGYTVVAGFDSDINHLDTIRTDIPVYPSYEIEEIVQREGISLAALTVPAAAAQQSAERLIAGGVKGILNFSSAHIAYDESIVKVKNMDVLGEFIQLSALINETN